MNVAKHALSCLAFAVAIAGANTPGWAVDATPNWEVGGFENPESVVVDQARGVLYVSNIAGGLTAKDGNGYLSRLAIDGSGAVDKWVLGFDAPKGLALAGNSLFVADIDQIVEVDVSAGKIKARYPTPGAKFLNDVAAGSDGTIYVSDTFGNTIWRLSGGKVSAWLTSDELLSPNGLLVEGDDLLVAAWGADAADGKPAKTGRLLRVAIATKKVSPWAAGGPEGNLDGLEPDGAGGYLVTNFTEGALFKVGRDGAATKVLELPESSADLAVLAKNQVALIPFLKKGKLAAYPIK